MSTRELQDAHHYALLSLLERMGHLTDSVKALADREGLRGAQAQAALDVVLHRVTELEAKVLALQNRPKLFEIYEVERDEKGHIMRTVRREA